MAQTVDARGFSCPVPVIKTKEAIEALPSGEIIVLVDEEVAKENVSRLQPIDLPNLPAAGFLLEEFEDRAFFGPAIRVYRIK